MINVRKNLHVGIVDELSWNGKNTTITIRGYCYIKGLEMSKNSRVKKSLVINSNKKKYYIPLNNEVRVDINNIEPNSNYQYAGFKGTIDLGFIDSMDSLSPGTWSLSVNLIVDNVEENILLKLDKKVGNIPSKSIVNKKNRCYVNIKPIVENGVIFIESKVNEGKRYSERKELKEIIREKLKPIINYFNEKKLEIVAFLYNQLKRLPLKNNRVLFLSDSRANMNGNFEFVYKELVSRGGFEIKSILKPSISAKLSVVDKFRLLYYVATSKYILLDDFYPNIYGFKLREGVELIQLWHACGAFKTFGFSRLGKAGGPKMRSKNHRNYTRAIVSSECIRKHYAEGFGISENKVVATGVPRTDIFFDKQYEKQKIDEIQGKYPILKNKKVIMFAPTFRGNGQKTAYYDFHKLDIEALYKELSDEYVIIMKLHPFVKNVPVIDEKYSDFIIDLSSEREINDLLFVSDILITDYSSVCFEFSLLNRPMIFFAYDMDDYIEKRDFYYPYEGFVPGNIVKTTKGIIDVIKNNKFDLNKLENFRNKFFTHLDGKSTKRVVDMMIELGNKNINDK